MPATHLYHENSPRNVKLFYTHIKRNWQCKNY